VIPVAIEGLRDSNRHVDLRHLRYFVAVVEARGFRQASRDLLVAQPALSSALGQLERELGVELLLRTPRGVVLTDAGRRFHAHARAILRQAEEAKAAMRECARRAPGIRIGAVAGILAASELTAPIVRNYRAARPDLQVELKELSFCDQVSPLLAGHLDVALVRGPLQHADLDIVPIALERRALMVGSEHELALEGEVDVADVLNEQTLPLGAPEEFSGFWQLNDLRGRCNADPDAAAATTIQDMELGVASSELVIGVPDGMARTAPNPLVRYVRLCGAEPSTIAVARRRGDRRRDIDCFIEQAQRTAEQRIELLGGAVSN
jgi:DNA-binding transcriptional LysR family regulator